MVGCGRIWCVRVDIWYGIPGHIAKKSRRMRRLDGRICSVLVGYLVLCVLCCRH